jgi:hypothetical protein
MDMAAVQAFVSTTLIDVGFKIWARSGADAGADHAHRAGVSRGARDALRMGHA